jgi:hypothetical protein
VGRGDGTGVRSIVARRQVLDRDIPASAKASHFKSFKFSGGSSSGAFTDTFY